MLDFLEIRTVAKKVNGSTVIYICPEFLLKKSSDLMIRGKDFYAIWDEEKGLWSTNEGRAIQLIDNELYLYYEKYKDRYIDAQLEIKYLYKTSTYIKWVCRTL